MNRQARLSELYGAADAVIGSLPGVHPTEKLSFRVASRVFVRIDLEDDIRSYGFKLNDKEARAACTKYQNVVPMKFGGMGKKGTGVQEKH